MDGINKLYDNFYKVGTQEIIIEKTSWEVDDDLNFFNPRSLSETFDSKPTGCTTEEISSLKKSIKDRGLLTALIGRIKNNQVFLINGHRRLTAIQQLIEEDADCYDPTTQSIVKASDLYKDVVIRLFDGIDELDCYVMAFEEDKTKVKFGAGTEYKFVQYCQDKNIPDHKILQMTGNNQSWLDGVKNLLHKLEEDHDILDALFSNKMNISAAKKLSMYDDKKERMQAFKEALQKAEVEVAEKKTKQTRSIVSTQKKMENALAEKAQATHLGDQSAEEAADALIENYRIQEEKQQQVIDNLEARVTGRNVIAPPSKSNIGTREKKNKKENKIIPIDEQTIPVSDVVKKWVHPLEKMIMEKSDAAHPLLLDFSKELINAIVENEQTCEEFLNKWAGIFENKGLVI